ncbi:S9 family peptidase [Steroidobacter sp.]|uniref:S9 family peptidase n=1 Tax=Steroidobacter sp. TaxID=1978227 RepID=UPI001A54C91D|nr:alpha/beta fold hydrolase [Steroidobacter sp.]MBL8269272.1 prolyl oligopeptidase family serine peptidase [Steroidobacter sp.]
MKNLLCAVLAGIVVLPAFDAGADPVAMDAAVYARAEALLGPNLEPKVRNVFVVPHWLGSSDEFWYERQLKSGSEMVVVDAATGRTRAPSATELDTIKQVKADQAPSDSNILLASSGDRGVFVQEGNLWVTAKSTGAPRALTTDGSANAGYGIWPDAWSANYVHRERSGKDPQPVGAEWAPDSRTVLVPYIDQRHVAAYPFLESVPVDGSFRPKVHPVRIALVGEKPATFEWRLIDTDTGKLRRVDLPYDKLLELQQDMTAFRDVWWSKDSKRLYLVAHGSNMESASLFEIEVATGASRTVIQESVPPRTDLNSTSYNPVNVRVVRDGREAIWFSQRDGWGHLYRYDVATGKQLNRITTGKWLVRDIIDIDEQRGVIFFTASGKEGGNPYYRYLYRANFDGSNLKLLTPEKADHLLAPNRRFVLSLDGITAHPAVSPSGKYVVYNFSRVDEPTRLAIRRVSDAGLVAEVEQADATELYAAGWRPPEEFVVKAADGVTDLWGTLYKPSDFDPKRKYPIIDAQYASPLIAVVPRHFYGAYRGRQPIAPSSYAELGFIVVSVDARGTTFRSKAFTQATYGKLNRIGLEDHIAAIKALAAERPYLDADRVGIVGHSYGGFAALRAMLEFPEFFKVGISSAAMVDTQGMYADYHWSAFQGPPVYSDGSGRRPTPTEIAGNWQSLNASSMVNKLQGKLLLQLGELDENVPPAQILSFVSSLIAANKDFEMLYLPDRNHSFIGEGYVMRRNWDFMVRNLLHREPPREYDIKVDRR